jgi:hypothetical protein
VVCPTATTRTSSACVGGDQTTASPAEATVCKRARRRLSRELRAYAQSCPCLLEINGPANFGHCRFRPQPFAQLRSAAWLLARRCGSDSGATASGVIRQREGCSRTGWSDRARALLSVRDDYLGLDPGCPATRGKGASAVAPGAFRVIEAATGREIRARRGRRPGVGVCALDREAVWFCARSHSGRAVVGRTQPA